MKISHSIALSFIAYLIISCQPSALFKKEVPKAMPDSVLFYQQKDLADPFIDAVIAAKEDTLILQTRLIPPPPPPKKFRQIEGLRVQVFAGLDSLNALSIRHQLINGQSDSVYLFKEKGLYKIQIGDYPYRMDADRKKQELRKEGFKGAWVVQTSINVPIDNEQSVSATEQDSVKKTVKNINYSIQVLATGDITRAQETEKKLKQQYNRPAFTKKIGNLYKVYLGNFPTRQEAEDMLKDIRANGYPDAWIVK